MNMFIWKVWCWCSCVNKWQINSKDLVRNVWRNDVLKSLVTSRVTFLKLPPCCSNTFENEACKKYGCMFFMSNCPVWYCKRAVVVCYATQAENFCLWRCQPSLTCANAHAALSSCDRCRLKASHTLVSHGTKCVIIAEALAHLFAHIPHPLTQSLDLLCSLQSQVNDKWKGNLVFFVRNTVVVSQ